MKKIYESRAADIAKLKEATGLPNDICEEAYDEYDCSVEKAYKALKAGKKPKDKRMFNVGDIVVCIDNKAGKLTPDCLEFLLTYKKFKVLEVNDKMNIHVGHRLENGNPYFFSPNRFELAEGKAPMKRIEPEKKEPQQPKPEVAGGWSGGMDAETAKRKASEIGKEGKKPVLDMNGDVVWQ